MKTLSLAFPAVVAILGLVLLVWASIAKKTESSRRERVTRSVLTQLGIILMLSGSFTTYATAIGEIPTFPLVLSSLGAIILFLLPVGFLAGLSIFLFDNFKDNLKNRLRANDKGQDATGLK